jgi:hypothetical protein
MATSLVPAGSDTGNELSEAFAALRDDEVLRRSVKTSQKYEKLWRGMLERIAFGGLQSVGVGRVCYDEHLDIARCHGLQSCV